MELFGDTEFEWSCIPSASEFILFSAGAGLLGEQESLKEAKARRMEIMRNSPAGMQIPAIYKKGDALWHRLE